VSATFDGSASGTPNGSITKWSWNFGDGTSAATTIPTVNHTYATTGTKTAKLTVTDSAGLSGTTSKKVTIG
jgi:PKD repeat protein